MQTVGKGSFGKVIQVKLKSNNQIYAMKVLKKEQVVRRKQFEHTMAERRILEEIEHPFIVSLRFAFQTSQKLYMVFDYFNGGELFHYLSKGGRFTEERARFYAAEISLGLEHIHGLNIIYRDLKPENLLLDADGHIRITDFGLSKENVTADDVKSFCGTPEYLAPEIITNKGHNLAVDWWALGILIFEMLVGQPPFCADDPMDIYQKILRNRVTYPAHLSKNAKDLLARLLVSNPVQRLGSLKRGPRDVLGHAFYKPTDFPQLLRKEIKAPYVPKISSPTDTSNFDDYEEENGEDWSRYNDKRQNLFKGF